MRQTTGINSANRKRGGGWTESDEGILVVGWPPGTSFPPSSGSLDAIVGMLDSELRWMALQNVIPILTGHGRQIDDQLSAGSSDQFPGAFHVFEPLLIVIEGKHYFPIGGKPFKRGE